MDDAAQLMLLYLIALAIIIMLLYLALRVTKKLKLCHPNMHHLKHIGGAMVGGRGGGVIMASLV